jgi:hypothetical protein
MRVEWSQRALMCGVYDEDLIDSLKADACETFDGNPLRKFSPDFVCRAINHFFTDLESNHRELLMHPPKARTNATTESCSTSSPRTLKFASPSFI